MRVWGGNWGGWGGATLPGSPPKSHHPLWEPSHALPAPQSTRAVPLGRRGGEGGGEKGREGGRALGRSPSPEPGAPQLGLGAGGLRLARPLPGTQGIDLPRSLGWEWGVMSRGGVIINQKK